MAVVKDTGNTWTLSIYPEAQPVERIEEPTKGYSAMLGYDPVTDRHLVMTVMYDKRMYPIGEVLKKIDEMKACPKCAALDKARLDNLTIETASPTRPLQLRDRVYPQSRDVRVVNTPLPPVKQNIKDMFANALFDAYLTSAGKLMVGNVFGDQDLVEESMPKTPDELAQLWEDTTSGKLLRSPGEAKEFMDIMRSQVAPGSTPVPTNQKKFVRNIVIG